MTIPLLLQSRESLVYSADPSVSPSYESVHPSVKPLSDLTCHLWCRRCGVVNFFEGVNFLPRALSALQLYLVPLRIRTSLAIHFLLHECTIVRNNQVLTERQKISDSSTPDPATNSPSPGKLPPLDDSDSAPNARPGERTNDDDDNGRNNDDDVLPDDNNNDDASAGTGADVPPAPPEHAEPLAEKDAQEMLAVLDIVKETSVAKICSKNWQMREKGLREIQDFLGESYGPSTVSREQGRNASRAMVLVLKRLLKDKVG